MYRDVYIVVVGVRLDIHTVMFFIYSTEHHTGLKVFVFRGLFPPTLEFWR